MAKFDIILHIIQHCMCMYMGLKTTAGPYLRGAMTVEKPHLEIYLKK